jgi:hypothetical protein
VAQAHQSEESSSSLHGQTPVVGFFRGQTIRYLDEGAIALAKNPDGSFVSNVDPIWSVTNGTSDQHNIIDNVPNLNQPNDYTPLWQVVLVTWNKGPRWTLRSAHEVQRALNAGRVTIKTTDTVVNCPVLGFDQKATVGFFRGDHVRYLDEGAIALATNPDGSYVSNVDPIWSVTNGTSGQHNIIDDVPNLNKPDDYTPLWQVVLVTWRPGLTPVTLSSAADVSAAASNGWVTLTTTATVVNCPVL